MGYRPRWMIGSDLKAVDLLAGLAVNSQMLAGKSDIGHTHTPAEVGLDQVDNTADADKPVSTATQAALANKVEAELVTEFPSSPTPGVLYLKAD